MSSRRISSRRNRTTISRRPRENEREKGDINSKSLIRFVVAFRCSFSFAPNSSRNFQTTNISPNNFTRGERGCRQEIRGINIYLSAIFPSWCFTLYYGKWSLAKLKDKGYFGSASSLIIRIQSRRRAVRDRSCHPCLRTLLPRGGEKICIIDQDTFQNVEQRGRSFHFSPPPLLRPFCMFTKKRRSASFVCRSPPSSTFYPSTFLLSRSIFSYHMYIYIYILCANPMLLFFLSLPASVSSPPVFLCFSHARSSIESLIHLLVYLPPRSPYFYPFSNIG